MFDPATVPVKHVAQVIVRLPPSERVPPPPSGAVVLIVTEELARSVFCTVSHVATPSAESERLNWLVQDVPAYSAARPPEPVRIMADVSVSKMLFLDTVRFVVVLFVVVAFNPVKFWSVDEAYAVNPLVKRAVEEAPNCPVNVFIPDHVLLVVVLKSRPNAVPVSRTGYVAVYVDPATRHVPFSEKHPLPRLSPPPNVEVAVDVA